MEVLWKYYSIPWTVLWVPYGWYYSVLQGTMESSKGPSWSKMKSAKCADPNTLIAMGTKEK